MKFVTKKQEDFYNQHSKITARGSDYQALIYLLGIDEPCREQFYEIYDVKENLIRTEVLHEVSQTQASHHICRLAFNLFTWGVPEKDLDNIRDYTAKELFTGMDADHKKAMLIALEEFA